MAKLRKKNLWDIKRKQGKFVKDLETGAIPDRDKVQEMIDEAIGKKDDEEAE